MIFESKVFVRIHDMFCYSLFFPFIIQCPERKLAIHIYKYKHKKYKWIHIGIYIDTREIALPMNLFPILSINESIPIPR